MQRLLSWKPRTCALLAVSCVSSSYHSAWGLQWQQQQQQHPSSSPPTSCAVGPSSPQRRLFSTNHPPEGSDHRTTTMPQQLTVAVFPCLQDNYGFLLHCHETGETAAIDTPDATAYQQALQRNDWKLTHIFNTHHHHDHTGGNTELQQQHGAQVYGPKHERIPGMNVGVEGGDTLVFGNSPCHVIDVGGHTRGHVAYYFPNENMAFVGDSLFSMGCGRMFEGDPQQFWASLQRLRELPDDTLIYCAHEYTESNARFALSVEPSNADLQARAKEVRELRAKGEATIPSLLGLEKKTNPFLRVDVSEEIRSNCGVVQEDDDATAFAKVRRAKDRF